MAANEKMLQTEKRIFLCTLYTGMFRGKNEYSSAHYSSSSAGMNIPLHFTQVPLQE
jgi:hypothetical protein